tara:strand:+ start:886 stop:1722 length:837 start_codon:yes stop_codon:yes gene_type:complete
MSSENQEVAVQETPTVLSGDQETKSPEINTDWKASLSDEMRAEKSLENIKDIESLAKSFVHAQKLVGADKIPVPNKYATEDDWNAVYKKLGRPEKPDGYKFDIGEDKTIEAEALNVFAEHSHKLGLLPTQAQGMVKFYQDMMAQQRQNADAVAEAARNDGATALKQEWGQAYPQKVESAKALVQTYFPKGIMSLNLEDGTKIGDHPEVIKAFATIAGKMGEDKIETASGPTYLTPKEIDKEIGNLTQPGSAYFDKNHPNHNAVVQEVLELRQKKYDVD